MKTETKDERRFEAKVLTEEQLRCVIGGQGSGPADDGEAYRAYQAD